MTTLLKEADIGKIWITGDKEQILLIENHTYVDYGMAVRETESRAAFLGSQRAMLMSKNRDEGNTDSKTYLSGMLPTDQIMPVYVLTIYYGAPAWDAPLNAEELYTPHVDMGPRLN